MKKYILASTVICLLSFAPSAYASSYHVFTCADQSSFQTFTSLAPCSGSGLSSSWSYTAASDQSVVDASGGVIYPLTSGATYYVSLTITGTGDACIGSNNSGSAFNEPAGTYTDLSFSAGTNSNRGTMVDNRGGSSQCGSGANLSGTISKWCVANATGLCGPALVSTVPFNPWQFMDF